MLHSSSHLISECPCDEHYICNQKMLKEVAARLPADWEKLGIYLDVTKRQRDLIGGEKRNKVEAWGLDMFNTWWQNSKEDTRWSDLQNALTEVHRHDLIQFTKDFFRDNNGEIDFKIFPCVNLLRAAFCFNQLISLSL